MTKSYGAMSIAELSVLIQTGAVDPVEVTEQVFAGIKAWPDKAVFITLLEERALTEARASSKRIKEGRSLGPLDGIPIAWKDLFDIQGLPTTAGSKVLKTAAPAAKDAAVVDLLKQAGMIAIGRTNMSEFAFSGIGINPHYGTPHNPRGKDAPRIPGGSSSGAGVAVGAGLVPVAMGTDTGGSIRIPSALNGTVGYKATRGRYAMDGVYPLAKSLDSLGPLCRTVQDAVWIDAAMRGLGVPSTARKPIRPLDIVIPINGVFDGAEPGVVAAFEATVERLQKAGCTVTRLAFPAFDELPQLMAKYGPMVTAEAFALHREKLAGPEAADIDHRVVARTRLGERTSTADYIAIIEARSRMTAATEALIGNRLVAMPSVMHVAPKIEPLLKDDEAFFAANGKTLRNTGFGNFLDWCGISIPCGTGDADMPVGFMLSGKANQDEDVLQAGMAYEDIIRG
ncbi:amidase [Rhizobium sp. XQZ8]|uniref:amidase n=1 Tax=Rhizobium populisoli TaxID=2859785 RepID=UPI001CA5AD34|nr:amidase [Rhizobium populisoli]MBW6421472.1 amidase [Rhizobium populisoli]